MTPSIFSQSRLIHFVKPTTGERKQTSGRELTLSQQFQCETLEKTGNKHAKKVAEQFRKGKIDHEAFMEISEVMKKPELMAQEEYQWFMQALAAGKFNDRAENAPKLLKALGQKGEVGRFAKKTVDNLRKESKSAMSPDEEQRMLRELTDLQAKEKLKGKGLDAMTVVEMGTTHSAIEKAARTSDKNWVMENAPEGLVERLDNLQLARFELFNRYNSTYDELEAAMAAKKEDKTLIARLEQELKDINAKIDKLTEEMREPEQQWINHMSCNAKRFEGIDNFCQRAGIAINDAKKIKMFVPISMKMEFQGKEIEIQILRIRFEKNKTDSTVEPDYPGEMMVDILNEKGEEEELSFKDAIKRFDTYGAHEIIDSEKDMNQRIEEESAYTDLQPGQEFETEIVDGFSATGEKITTKQTFRIESIDPRKRTVKINKTLPLTPRALLSLSMDNAMYHEKEKDTFSFGEFVKLVRQNRYNRHVGADEAEGVIKRAYAARLRDYEEMMQTVPDHLKNRFEPPKQEFTVPKEGETTEIFYLDKNNYLRKASLSRKDGKFYRKEIPLKSKSHDGPSPESLINAGLPMNMVSARLPNLPERDAARKAFTQVELPANQVCNLTATNKFNPQGITTAAQPEATDEDESDEDQPEAPKQVEIKPTPEAFKVSGSKKVFEEALNYSDIYKAGGFTQKSETYLRQVWKTTRFFSVMDLWAFGKAMWEYYDRRWQRRQKDRYSSVGTDIPWFAPEMKRINQAAETEEMNQFKETFDQKGVFEIEGRVHDTHNRDEMKAAFVTLASKGLIRWDDIEMWKNLNRFTNPSVAIPIPSNGDPYTRISTDDPRTGFDFLQGAIDSLWGEGQYNDWFKQNKSTFASNAKNYYEEGKQLEGYEGGHGRRLATLLGQHKRGEYVDPQEYEGLLLHSIEAGKARMQQKLYYMVEGVAAENSTGRTILSFDRMAHFNSEMLIRFPLLEYLCGSALRPDGKEHRWTKDDYKKWIREHFDRGDPSNVRPGVGVDEFLWKYVLPSDHTQNRINKAMRHGENLDHDDMFAYLPPASEQLITDTCKATVGTKKFLTVEGYANVFPGFSQYLRTQSENNNRGKLRESIKSYVRFEGIMLNRFEKEKDSYQRLDRDMLNNPTIVTSTPPQSFIDGMNEVVEKIVDAYADVSPELKKAFELTRTKTYDIHSSPAQMKLQKKINFAFEQFGELFDAAVKSDNGAKMTAITAAANLEGMPFGLTEEEIAARKRAFSDNLALE